MADDKVSHSKTGRGPTRLKNMFKKINKDDKIPLSIDVHTGVANMQRNIVLISEYYLMKGSLS